MNKPWLRRGAVCLLLGLAVFSGWKLISYWGASRQAEAGFSELSAKVHAAVPSAPPWVAPSATRPTVTALPSATAEPEPDEVVVLPENLDVLRAENSNLYGWVTVDDTRIDYPVMHTPWDPEYYLRRDFTGRYSVSGTPFLDGRCDSDSDHLILWGHNMYTGTMFADLSHYRKERFAERHGEVVLTTPEGAEHYQVIAAFDSVPGDFPWYDTLRFESEADFSSFVDGLTEHSLFPLPASPEYGGRFLTLATCSGKDDGRLVVVAYRPPQ